MRNIKVPGCYHTGKLEGFFRGHAKELLARRGGFNELKKSLETSTVAV